MVSGSTWFHGLPGKERKKTVESNVEQAEQEASVCRGDLIREGGFNSVFGSYLCYTRGEKKAQNKEAFLERSIRR